MTRKSDLRNDTSWVERAMCKGKTNLFFGHSSEKPSARMKREAAAAMVCAQCEVAAQCKDYARQNNEYGFWGGESEESRYRAGHLNTSYMRFLISKRDKNKNDVKKTEAK